MKKDSNNHLVAFVDILGFKNLVDDYYKGKNPDAINKLEHALKDAEKNAIKFNQENLKDIDISFTYKQFSDCVSISMALNQSNSDKEIELILYFMFINLIRTYQTILLFNDIPV